VQSLVARRRDPVRRAVDDEASKADLVTLLRGCRFAHLACHGVFRPDAPDASGLVLIPTPGSHEVLSLREFSALDLTNLQHVTLSSCWSADYFALPGRWVMSLPETLCRCGAGSVLGCLWPVDDALAVTFMERFYRYSERYALHEALRRTQVDSLQGQPVDGRADAASLTHWSGFCLHVG
jgi:CHAT domain-containing protein